MSALVAVILAGVFAEAAALLAYRARTGRGPSARNLLPNLAAGAMLLLALLLSLEGFALPALALCLLGALVAHIVDLRMRWSN